MIGAHMSIAGGLHLACERAAALELETMQIFTKNERQWKAKPITDADAAQFKKAVADAKLSTNVAHDTYLHNLASPNPELWRKSVDAFTAELERCELLGLSYLITHPGSPGEAGAEVGIKQMRTALKEITGRTKGLSAKILLETTAGQGACLGCKFDQLGEILDGFDTIGVCLDTCHVFAAGYDHRTRAGYDAMMDEFDKHVGIERLRAFHLNDSKKDLGCRVDRHENLGKGFIGLDTFGFIVNDPRFANVPKVIETPKEDNMDPVNLALLRGMVKKAKKPARSTV